MKRWIIVACVLVVLGAIAYAVYATQMQQAPTPVTEEPSRAYVVSFEDSYEGGVHTIEGSVTLDTPCETLEAAGVAVGNNIRVDLRVPPLEGVCLQRPAEHEFSVDVEAPEDATVAVFVNGIPATIQ